MRQGDATTDPRRSIPPAVLRALLRIPPLSPVAAKLYALKEHDADIRKIAGLISSDPSLSTLVLRLVNSPLFGVRHPVTGVLQAAALLGFDRLRALSTTAALRMLVKPSSSPALTRCWRHSVACALATRELAKKTSFD